MYFLDPGRELRKVELDGLLLLERVLRQAQVLAATTGSRLVLVFVPTKYRVYRDAVTFPDGSDCASWVLNDLPRRLEKLALAISPEILYLDLTPRFRRHASAGTLLYFLDDTHWTRAGHEVVAEALTPLLLDGHIGDGDE